MNKHTQEPWKFGGVAEIYSGNNIIADFGYELDADNSNIELLKANAMRAVVCVNACAGIENPDVTIPILKNSQREYLLTRSLLRDSENLLSEIVKQRDELLAMFEEVVALGNHGDVNNSIKFKALAVRAAEELLDRFKKKHIHETPPRRDIEEFTLLWFELAQKWVVVFPDGFTIDRNFGAVGYASNAAYEYTGRGEVQWDYDASDTTVFYYKAEDHWENETPPQP